VEHDSKTALGNATQADETFDAMILDIGLPGMDGYELARRLRAARPTARVLLIALTGYGQADDRDKSHAAGFDHHLMTPANISEIVRLFGRTGGD
jgi:CheY-like chemotaxis protein